MDGPRATIVVNNRDPRVWHRIDLCNALLVAQSLFAAREYRPLLRRRSASVIAERRAMTHGARISRESDVAHVIPDRERKQIAGGGWGRKKYFYRSLQAVWPGVPNALSTLVTGRMV